MLGRFLLPPQGFGPEAKTQGGTLGLPACIRTRSYKEFQKSMLAIDATTAFTILKSVKYEFLKRFLVQGRQQSF